MYGDLDAYDDMMGLEFGDYEGLDQFITREQLRDALLSSTAGGGAILLASWGAKQLTSNIEMINKIENPLMKSVVVGGLTFLAGIAGGRALYNYNTPAAIGVTGGVGGLAMAHIIDTAIAQFTDNPPMGVSLGEADDYMNSYGDQDGMAALAALETTGVTTAPGAFSGMGDPSVTPEALMGLDGTVVQQETLGAYAPYLS